MVVLKADERQEGQGPLHRPGPQPGLRLGGRRDGDAVRGARHEEHLAVVAELFADADVAHTALGQRGLEQLRVLVDIPVMYIQSTQPYMYPFTLSVD